MQSSYKLNFPGFAAKCGVEHSTSVYGDANLTAPRAQDDDGTSSFVQGLFGATPGGSGHNSNNPNDPSPGV